MKLARPVVAMFERWPRLMRIRRGSFFLAPAPANDNRFIPIGGTGYECALRERHEQFARDLFDRFCRGRRLWL